MRDRSVAMFLCLPVATTVNRGNPASPRSRTGCAPTTNCSHQRRDAMCRSAARAFKRPLCGGEGWTIRPRRGARQDVGHFSSGQEPGRKARPPLTDWLGVARPAPRGVPFSLVTFLYFGHPALRPTGRLRRSHALLRVREQAKKSDPGRGSGSEARRRRARSRNPATTASEIFMHRNDEHADRRERPSRTGCAPTEGRGSKGRVVRRGWPRTPALSLHGDYLRVARRGRRAGRP